MNSRVNEKSLFGLFALFPLTYLTMCTLSVHWIYRRGFLGFKITTQAARTPGFYTRQDIYYTRESMAVTVHDTAHIINIIHVAYMYYILEDRCVHLIPCYCKTKFVSKFSLPLHVNKLLEHRLGYEIFLARLAIGYFL